MAPERDSTRVNERIRVREVRVIGADGEQLGVMAPELAREMTLSPAALSTVASSFFLAYAVMQLPTGMLLDFKDRRATAVGPYLK